MAELTIESQSEAETQALGARLADALQSGLTIALNGQLGSGKTHLVRSVCTALGVNEDDVNSPTFVLMQTYAGGRLPVFHFDTYRLGDVDEFVAIGAEEYLLDPDVVCFVEWAARIAEVLPADHLVIEIEQTAATSRRFTISSTGQISDAVIQRLALPTPQL
jgi:tRNA threonylcarbamoyladenosine biosynthesis protein TsaE